MPRLTWQNVDNPNFSGIADSYKTFSELLGNAVKSGSTMGDIFTKAKSDAADRAIQLRALQIQDPAAQQAALVNGTLVGADGANASAGMLKSMDQRRGDLVDVATSQNNMDFTQYGRKRLIDANTRSDVADPAKVQYLLARQSGDDKTADALLASNPALAALTANEVTALANTGDDFTSRNNSRYSTKRSRDQDTFNDSAAADAETLRQQGYGLDPANDEWILNNQGWDPKRTQRALQRASGGGGTAAPSGGAGAAISAAVGGSGTSGFNLGAPQQAVGAALKESGLPDAVVAGFLGNFHIEGGYSGAKGDGGAAVGIAQWRGDRQANFRQVIGKDVSAASPQEQARFVKWEMDNPEKAGMTVEQRDAILNAKTPQEAAALIDQHYERSNGKARAGRSAAAADAYSVMFPGVNLPTKPDERIPPLLRSPETNARNEIAGRVSALVNESLRRQADPSISSRENATTRERISGSQIDTLIPQYEKLLGADPEIIDAANLVAKKVGGDPGTISTHIREVMAEGSKGVNKINIATAAAIVQASAKSGTDGLDLWGLWDWAAGNSFGGGGAGAGTWTMDPDRRAALIKEYTSGVTRGQIQNLGRESRAQQGANTADQAVAGLLQTLQRAQAAKEAGRTGMDPLIKRLNEQLERAALQASGQAKALGQIQATEVPASAAQVLLDQAAKGPDPVVSDRVTPSDRVMYLN